METKLLAELVPLKPGATMCPGELARRLGTTQKALRPTLVELQQRGVIKVTQGGKPKSLASVRGPYRVALG